MVSHFLCLLSIIARLNLILKLVELAPHVGLTLIWTGFKSEIFN